MTDPSSCTNTVSSILKSGSGKINLFNNNIFIQNETLTGNHYRPGNTISAGSLISVTLPGGPVSIKNGANVIFDADGAIMLDWGFGVESGATFEAN